MRTKSTGACSVRMAPMGFAACADARPLTGVFSRVLRFRRRQEVEVSSQVLARRAGWGVNPVFAAAFDGLWKERPELKIESHEDIPPRIAEKKSYRPSSFSVAVRARRADSFRPRGIPRRSKRKLMPSLA